MELTLLSQLVEERSSSVEVVAEATVERGEVRMLARVTATQVRALSTENLRFPWQWQSSKG